MDQEMIAEPTILAAGTYDLQDLAKLRQDQEIWNQNDVLASQLDELFEVLNPDQLQNDDFLDQQELFVKQRLGDQPDLVGNWVYMPWNGQLIHMSGQADFERLRSNRNQNLVTAEEQARIGEASISIAGLSVGNGIAIGLAQHGIRSLRLSDDDSLSTCNLNRLRAGVFQIGLPKQEVLAQQLWELNPYLNLAFMGRLTDETMSGFLDSPKPVAIFDEIDDFEMKIRLRLAARERGIPVLMLTSLGDNILIDIERYDLDPKTEIFGGLLGTLPEQILNQPMTEAAKIRYAVDLVGADYVPTRALASLLQINRTLVGRPQIASAVIMDGGIGSFLVRRLILGQDLPAGRYYLSLTETMKVSEVDIDQRETTINLLRRGLQ